MVSSPIEREQRRRLIKRVLVALILGNFAASFVFFRFNDDARADEAHAVHLQAQDEPAPTPPTIMSHAMDMLDRQLAGMKRQVTHSVAWSVIKHVEERLGSDPKGINPQLLEAEVERAVAKHDNTITKGQDLLPSASDLAGDQANADEEVHTGGAGEGEKSGASQAKSSKEKLASALKAVSKGGDKRNSKGSEITNSADVLSVARNRNAGSRYSAFKASIESRTAHMKQLAGAGQKAAALRAGLDRPGGQHGINAVRESALNKMQEKAAMSSGKISGNPGSWLGETEKSLKRKESYSCSKHPILPPPERGLRQEQQQLTPQPTESPPPVPAAPSWGSSLFGALHAQADPVQAETITAEPPATPPIPPAVTVTTLEASEYTVCQAEETVHVAITINHEFQQGAIALIYSILWNAACPSRVVFHICHLENYRLDFLLIFFPKLNYRSYIVDGASMKGAIRGMDYRGKDLENPLNYVRINLPHILPDCVKKFIYVDTDTLMLGRIEDMFATDVSEHVIGSPENCDYKLESYFTKDFWGNKTLSQRFKSEKKDCYFNPGVMVVNAVAWRNTGATKSLLHWMSVQKRSSAPLYTLGSLPPFLLVFAGSVAHMGMAWNEHDLGCGCSVIPVPSKARLLHWSCGGKPWRRIKSGTPCTIDTYYWQPYDLVGKIQPSWWCDDGDLPERLERLPIAWPSRDDEGDDPDKDIPKGMETVLFEQVFNRPKKRRCPGPVHIPLLGHTSPAKQKRKS